MCSIAQIYSVTFKNQGFCIGVILDGVLKDIHAQLGTLDSVPGFFFSKKPLEFGKKVLEFIQKNERFFFQNSLIFTDFNLGLEEKLKFKQILAKDQLKSGIFRQKISFRMF